jgi:leucyl-tRNA synthetase
MSKSRGNTVSPDKLIEDMGADTERVYTLFLGPPEDEVEWNDDAVYGAFRFLNRVVRMQERLTEAPANGVADQDLERLTHQTVERVTRDLEKFKFNTAIAALMEFMNGLSKAVEEKSASRVLCEAGFDTLLQLLHPMAPHLTEELWEQRGHADSLLDVDWPEHDPDKLSTDTVELVVQVDGKLRDRVAVPTDVTEARVRDLVLASDRVVRYIEGREIARMVFVPGRLVNFVTRGRA